MRSAKQSDFGNLVRFGWRTRAITQQGARSTGEVCALYIAEQTIAATWPSATLRLTLTNDIHVT